jgi:hypothetical protein
LTVNRQPFGLNCLDGDETLAHQVTSPSARGRGGVVLHRARRIASGQADGLQMSASGQRPGRQSALGLADGLQTNASGQRPGRQTGVLPGVGNLTECVHRVLAVGLSVRWHFEWGRANAPVSPVRLAAAR